MFQPESRKIETEQEEIRLMQAQMDEDDEDMSDCEQLLRQMDALEKEKKELLSGGKYEPNVTKKN